MTTENESTDYQLGYDAGFEAGKQAARDEIESGAREGMTVYGLESWSFLSDKEVRNLVGFVEKLTLMSDAASNSRAAYQRIAEVAEEQAFALCEDSQRVLQSILSTNPVPVEVEFKSINAFMESNTEV